MSGRVLSIQDLSCVGRCSLTVALPVLSAMGVECAVLPTAVLSTHTGFPGPQCLDLTDRLADFSAHWAQQGICFDAVEVGYLSDPAQARTVGDILTRFGKFVVLDPVMGDNGRLYRGISPDHPEALKTLCKQADVLLPNVTEAALLAGLPYRQEPEDDFLRELAQGLLALGPDSVLITGVRREDKVGFFGISPSDGSFSFFEDYVPRSLHGTGDLFAAAFTGAWMAGRSVPEAGALAARFVRRCVSATGAVTPFGASFETVLPWLWQQLSGPESPESSKSC